VWVVAAIGILIIAGVVLASVFGNKYALESKLKEALKDNGHTVSKVTCPNSINTGAGHTYQCTAVVDGETRTETVMFIGGRRFRYSPT
jgi:hypothetical protein